MFDCIMRMYLELQETAEVRETAGKEEQEGEGGEKEKKKKDKTGAVSSSTRTWYCRHE